jgi:hypothetical protein
MSVRLTDLSLEQLEQRFLACHLHSIEVVWNQADILFAYSKHPKGGRQKAIELAKKINYSNTWAERKMKIAERFPAGHFMRECALPESYFYELTQYNLDDEKVKSYLRLINDGAIKNLIALQERLYQDGLRTRSEFYARQSVEFRGSYFKFDGKTCSSCGCEIEGKHSEATVVLRRDRSLVPVCSNNCGLAYYSGLVGVSGSNGYVDITGSVPLLKQNPRHKHIPSHVIA